MRIKYFERDATILDFSAIMEDSDSRSPARRRLKESVVSFSRLSRHSAPSKSRYVRVVVGAGREYIVSRNI